MLLKADVDGPAWMDARIADAYGCHRQTVENLRERLVTEGFEHALNGQVRKPRPNVLDGTQAGNGKEASRPVKEKTPRKRARRTA
jgi:hypothetical protein